MVEIFGDFTFRWGVGRGGITPIYNNLFFWQNDFILRGKGGVTLLLERKKPK